MVAPDSFSKNVISIVSCTALVWEPTTPKQSKRRDTQKQNKTNQSLKSDAKPISLRIWPRPRRANQKFRDCRWRKRRKKWSSESLFHRNCWNRPIEFELRPTVRVSTPTTANPRSTRPIRDQISVCMVSSKVQKSNFNIGGPYCR